MGTPWRRILEPGAKASGCCAMAQGHGAWRRRKKKTYKLRFKSEKGLQKFDGEELFL
jgi:hypothetical protein